MTGHTGAVTGLGWSSDGRFIASADMSGSLRVWDADTGTLQRSFNSNGQPFAAAAFSPPGAMLAL